MSFLGTRLVGFGVDIAALALAYYCAFLLRFDFADPRWGWRAVALSFSTVGAAYMFALIAGGCYRLAWRRTTLAQLPRYLLAALSACAFLTLLRFLMPVDNLAHVRPPYSVTLINFILSTIAIFGWRLVWRRFAARWVREEALLERSVRTMDFAGVRAFVAGKTVMVTGAGGSIGSEIVRQLAECDVKTMLLVERCENALYEIDRKLKVAHVPLMVDINDAKRMEELFAQYRPELVLHAAAYKHVPMVELNPREGERNNTAATASIASLAAKYGVERFVMISTDKAVNPVSVMGKTKLAAEQAIMALNGGATKFCAVRFGNVLGSSGSVVPLFKEQIAAGGPVTVTDPNMKRYFMNVSEAVGLVLQAASRKECAIYTLDMGKPVKIVDLAETMIRQAGYKPYVDIPIVFSGVRPGEKLFEELDISEKSVYKTDMAKIYINQVK